LTATGVAEALLIASAFTIDCVEICIVVKGLATTASSATSDAEVVAGLGTGVDVIGNPEMS